MTIFAGLDDNFSIPILVVQHRAPDSENILVSYLNDSCVITIKEGIAGEPIIKGHVYISPGGYHMLVENDRTISLATDLPEKYSIPSINVLFRSAADVYADRLIGVILTGANDDGADGMKEIKINGGLTISQDPDTAEAMEMPLAAINQVNVDHVLTLKEISDKLRSYG